MTLRQVCDEEGVQNKALHFLSSFVGLRMAITPEVCHPKWNAFKRACEHSENNNHFDLMRLSIAANYGHGTKLHGERATNRQLMLEHFLRNQTDDWFDDISAEIALDRGIVVHNSDECRFLLEDFLECDSIRKRGDFVTGNQFNYFSLVSLTKKKHNK